MADLPISERGHAHPELLAETGWLAEHANDDSVRIIDARPTDQYDEGHISGAVSLPGMGLYGADGSVEIPNVREFREVAASVGVDDETTVVVYDNAGPPAGRVAWAFMYYGHRDTRLLDGGLAKWLAEGRDLSTDSDSYEAGAFAPRPQEGLYCGLDLAKSRVGETGTVIWDVRGSDEYDGSNTRGNPEGRAGHIAGAVNLNWTSLIDQDSRTLKPAEELRELLSGIGVTPESEVVSY